MTNLLFKFSLPALAFMAGCGVAFAQIGVGTAMPQARLHVYNGTFLALTPTLPPQESPFYDLANFDDDPVHHAFKWIPEKSAFRALGAGIYSTTLQPASVGKFSFASGFDVLATGLGASARGMRASAGGFGAFASGQTTIAGYNFSFVQGYISMSSGPNCITMGTHLENNSLTGAFIMGHSTYSFQSTSNHQFKMLFVGGYRFYTNNLLTSGAALPTDANAWNVVSDASKKENLAAVDGQQFLQKMEVMPLSSWNYKGQDPKAFRHYGPMAQDFFKTFGRDQYGTIGADTTINQADMDGVTLIAIQALVEQTDELQKINDDLERELSVLRKRMSGLMGFRHSKKETLLASERK